MQIKRVFWHTQTWVALSLGLGLGSFVWMDPWYGYVMCALCLAQRGVMIMMAVCMWAQRSENPVVQRVAGAMSWLCAALGASLSLWHMQLLYGANAPACPLFIKQTALSWWGGWFARYRWIPCEAVQLKWLGVELAVWSLLFFVAALTVQSRRMLGMRRTLQQAA